MISHFADIVALVYHEGRNVRHLARKEQVEIKFLALRDRLDKNRHDAWKRLQPLRREAAKAKSCNEVQRLFEREFGLTLDDMVTLYGYTSWKGTDYGGNAWLPIVRNTIKVYDLLDASKDDDARELLVSILESFHNTGKVSDKLKELDNSL